MGSNVVSVHPPSHTVMMEQLQEAYVLAVASAAACVVSPISKDTFKKDVLITRPRTSGIGEDSIYAQMKSTTTSKPDPTKATFSYQFKDRKYMEDLVADRPSIPAILIVMATHPVQAKWTTASHESLTVVHACYWKCLAGDTVPAGVHAPSTKISTGQIFDSAALTAIMDRLERGEAV